MWSVMPTRGCRDRVAHEANLFDIDSKLADAKGLAGRD
jgi:hypothetical protein